MSWLYQTPSISFDASFESGNLASAERINEFEYDLFIQPDCQTPTRMWFYFRCSGVPTNLPVLFNIIGINKVRTTFATQQRILVRSTSRTKWQRLPAGQQFYTNSSKHKCYGSYPVLSFTFEFDKQEEYFFAFGYPYTFSMLQKFLGRIEDHHLPFVNIETIGSSSQDRPISCITIGKLQNLQIRYAKTGEQPQQQHVVLITARCHSGEFPGSYVCHGILEYLLSNNPRARFLRNNVVFKIIPMINVDGVFCGNYRTNAQGLDVNRCYFEPPPAAPEAVHIRSLFEQFIGPERQDDRFDNPFTNTLSDIAAKYNIQARIAPLHNDSEEQSSDATSKLDNWSETPKVIQPNFALPKPESRNSKKPLSAVSQRAKSQSTVAGIKKPPSILIANVSQPAFALLKQNEILQVQVKMDYQTALQLEMQKQEKLPPHRQHLDFVIDLHSHSNISGGFLFLNPDSYLFHKSKRQACEQVFPQILSRNCSVFGSLQSSFKESKNLREGSLRRAFCNLGRLRLGDDAPYVYALEISNSHGPDPAEGGQGMLQVHENNESSDQTEDEEELEEAEKFVFYTPDKYMQVGEKICDSLFEIYSELFKQ